MIAVDEKTIMGDLHRDGAEALPHSSRARVSERGPKERAPVEPVVVVEAAILGGDKGGANMLGHVGQRYVDAPHHGQAPDQPAVAVEDATALARVKGADLVAARAARESAGGQPGIKDEDADD